MNPAIQHSPTTSQFRTADAAQHGVLQYRLNGGVMSIVHTEVAPEHRGRGVAAALMQAALAHARAHALKVRPLCSYASVYMKRHLETQDLLA
ncbi:MAG TPA: GNAT family N-acetyltransferase [Burkholderiaceae bacterium]|nr:GNAT family N-acetyltransferase [Burkholderiaceae bacterium]